MSQSNWLPSEHLHFLLVDWSQTRGPRFHASGVRVTGTRWVTYQRPSGQPMFAQNLNVLVWVLLPAQDCKGSGPFLVLCSQFSFLLKVQIV